VLWDEKIRKNFIRKKSVKNNFKNFYKKPLRHYLGLHIQIDPSKFQLDSSNRVCAILHTTLKNTVSRKTRLKFEDVMNNHFYELTFNLRFQDHKVPLPSFFYTMFFDML